MAAEVNRATLANLREAVKVVEEVDVKTNQLFFRPLSLNQLCLRGFSDASLGNAEKQKTQCGGIVFLCDKGIYNPISFYSRIIRRVTRSTFASELFGLSALLDDMIYTYHTINEFFPLDMEVYIDCKSVVENLSVSNPRVTEKRLLLELNSIRDMLVTYNIKIFHITGDKNPADCLTKTKKFSSAMTEVLRTGRFEIDRKYELTNVFLAEHESIVSFCRSLEFFAM